VFYFDRVCKIIIENKARITIENCKIKFEIIKSAKPKENMAKIEIYNLAPDTRRMITEEESICRILAGYSKNEGLIEIGQGDISKIKHNRDKTEVVTEMYLAEGIRTTRTKPVSFGYGYDTNLKLSTILQEITKQTGGQFRTIDIDQNKTIKTGYSDSGSLDYVMNNLAVNFNFDWSMQNGVIVIKGNKSSSKKEILLLTPETGLILHPESVKKVSKKLEKSEITKMSKKSRSVQCLLQPKLQIHDVIRVQSGDINGLFEVQKITHSGDMRGNDWYSSLEIYSL
jgi:hypothetical protein